MLGIFEACDEDFIVGIPVGGLDDVYNDGGTLGIDEETTLGNSDGPLDNTYDGLSLG